MFDKRYLLFSLFFLVTISLNPTLNAQIPDPPEDFQSHQLRPVNDLPSPIFVEPVRPGPEHVFVVYNINSSFGDSIASYYQAARQIPQSNICAIACDTAEVITREYYNTSIRDVLRDSLIQRGLKDQIRFIVLTKGVPLKISGTDMSSLNSELCLLFNEEYSTSSRIYNPYFGEIHHFNSFTYPANSSSKISYLVSRLDAFTLDDVLGMIDRGANPDTTGICWYILDDYPGLTYDRMNEARLALEELGQNVVYDSTTSHITTNEQGKVIGYCGHGIHAGDGYPFVLNTLNFELANGALFNTYESYNGYSFFPEGRISNHNLVADFIAIGGTGGIGHVYEPYASAIPHENLLFARYANGYPLIEAAYMSMAYLTWQNVVVGDPLCQIKAEILPYDPPPLISSLPIIFFNEDDSLSYPLANWYPYVIDFTASDEFLIYDVSGGKHITSVDRDSCFLFRAEENWFGEDSLILLVSDRLSTVQADLVVSVFPVNDPPLISKSFPDSIFFSADSSICLNIWSFVEDPDQTDSLLTYHFPLKNSNDTLIVNYSDSSGILCLRSEPGFTGNILMYVEVEDDSSALAKDSIIVIVLPALGLKDEIAVQIPDKYILHQNFPNPFNPLTRIKFALPKADQVKIEIYTSLGQKVETLLDKTMKAGYHDLEFNGQNFSSGIYFYRIQAGKFQDVKKMILIK